MVKPRPVSDCLNIEFGTTCQSCDSSLEPPWVRCVVCKPAVDLCSRCFCYGVEFGGHESDHSYTVVKYDFPLFESTWTAAEELNLLEAIQEHGIGNWAAVASRMTNISKEECERHYLKCYVDSPQHPLPEFPDSVNIHKGAPVTFKLSDNPPRPAEHSLLWREMGGYSAARCDFNEEYDNYVECEIGDMTLEDVDGFCTEGVQREFDDDELTENERRQTTQLCKDLNVAVVDVYRNTLLERQRRKKIIREYGLINMRRVQGIFKRRYEQHLRFDFLRTFMRLFPSVTFDKYLESLLYERQLFLFTSSDERQLQGDIRKLQEYRENGITKMNTVKHFHTMKRRRTHMHSQRHLLTDVLNNVRDDLSCQAWLAKQTTRGAITSIPVLPVTAPRKSAPRLNIEGLPGYDRLNSIEREFCSESRLVPQAYLDFSKILTTENSKHGSLRLAQARQLIKIDVNKTRKLFDFLILHGHIVKAA